jgi:hypothetical protein
MVEGHTAAKIVGAGALGAAAGYLLRAQKVSAAALAGASSTVDMTALLAKQDIIIEELADLINATSTSYKEKSDKGLFTNPQSFNAGTMGFQVINTGIQMPGYDIPFGIDVVVQADVLNIGIILVSTTGARAKTLSTSFPLVPGQNLKLKLPNLDRIWLSCTNVTDTVHWIVEGAKVG